MNKQRKKKIIGLTMIILAIILWAYIGAWLNFIKPFTELTYYVLEEMSFNLLEQSKRIVIKFALITMASIMVIFGGIDVMREK